MLAGDGHGCVYEALVFVRTCMDMANMGSELVLCVCKLAKQIFGANPAKIT